MSPSATNRRLVGTLLCALSALAYTATNICLRRLSELGGDPIWVVFNKESVTVIVLGAWLLHRACRGHRDFPDRRTLGLLIVVGLLTQLIGNIALQWAMGVIGLSASVPAVYCTEIAGVAILGWIVLREHVTPRSMTAILALWVSLGLLGMGAEIVKPPQETAAAAPSGSLVVTLGVLAACSAGVIFSILSVATCHSVRRTTSPLIIAFLITLMGTLSLGPISFLRLGVAQMLATPPEQFALMAASGAFNFVGFVSLGYGLQRTTALHANVLSASQVALSAMAGMALFRETPNAWLLCGISLTILGILAAGTPAHDDQLADKHI